MKNFGEKEAWAYLGTAQIFWVPPIIPGTGKATDFSLQIWPEHSHSLTDCKMNDLERLCRRICSFPDAISS